MAPTVSIIGATITGNRGAEAMLVTSIGKVRDAFPGARFVIHSYFPDEDRALCEDTNVEIVDAAPVALVLKYFPASVAQGVAGLVGLKVPRFLMPLAPRRLAESDVLLDVFGVSYNDGREKFLPFNVLSNWPSMLLGTPVVKLSQGMGTYNHPATRTVGRWMINKCQRVFARGAESLEMARDVGIGAALDYAPDIAFVFESRYAISTENPAYAKEVAANLAERRAAGERVLVLSVSAVVEKKVEAAGSDYAASMAAIVDAMLAEGVSVVLFSNANREGKASRHNNDIPVAKAVAQQVRDPGAAQRLITLDKGLNAGGLREVMSEADFLVASRFHAMIGGLSLGVPTLVLGWSHKYREILAMFGLEEWAFDFSQLDVPMLVERIKQLMDTAPSLREKISSNIQRVESEANKQFEWLVGSLADATGIRPQTRANLRAVAR